MQHTFTHFIRQIETTMFIAIKDTVRVHKQKLQNKMFSEGHIAIQVPKKNKKQQHSYNIISRN